MRLVTKRARLGTMVSIRNTTLWTLALSLTAGAPAFAQSALQQTLPLITPVVPNQALNVIAQSPSSDMSGPQPIDLTPVRLPRRNSIYNNLQDVQTNILFKLPPRLFIDVISENSLRWESNVFQTEKQRRSDMIFRTLPQATVGYALTKQTRVAANYFFFRDQYTEHSHWLSRNVHSVGVRMDHDFILSPKTMLTAGIFGRELFVSKTANVTDVIPSLTLIHRTCGQTALYASVMGQIRFKDMIQRFQEADPFYSIGAVYRGSKWQLLADTTLIDSFGDKNIAARNGVANYHQIVQTFEIGRRLPTVFPLVAFVRAQPIYNIGQQKRMGFAGVNVRVFGGIRAEIAKPALFPVRLAAN